MCKISFRNSRTTFCRRLLYNKIINNMISKKDYSQKYNCLLCNKFYTSRQSFCNHKNIYHKNEYMSNNIKYNSKVTIMHPEEKYFFVKYLL